MNDHTDHTEPADQAAPALRLVEPLPEERERVEHVHVEHSDDAVAETVEDGSSVEPDQADEPAVEESVEVAQHGPVAEPVVEVVEVPGPVRRPRVPVEYVTRDHDLDATPVFAAMAQRYNFLILHP